jgi:predicted phosphoribosyltransferase
VLREHVIIVVADGLKDGQKIDAISEYLKPIKVKRLIIVVPIASVQAVDRMHIVADEIHCLAVTENYFNASHYYDVNEQLTHEQAIYKVKNIVLGWR